MARSPAPGFGWNHHQNSSFGDSMERSPAPDFGWTTCQNSSFGDLMARSPAPGFGSTTCQNSSKVLSFIGNNGWESALTLRFWMGLGPFLAYLSMLANNEWPSLPILARIQLSTAGLEFVEGRGLEQKGTVLLGKQKGYNQMTTSSYFFVCGWMGSMTVNVLQEWMCYQHIHKSSLKSKTYGCFPSNTLKLICSQTVRGSWRHKFSWSWKWQAWSYAKSRLWPLGLGSNTLRTQHFLERRSKHW